MEENVFFENDNVSVSNSRFIVNGQTYAMSNVTSVKTGFEPANKAIAVIAIIVGAIALYNSFYTFGIIAALVGILLFYFLKDTHSVILNTSSGENQALTSSNKQYIALVVSALNDAIVSRG